MSSTVKLKLKIILLVLAVVLGISAGVLCAKSKTVTAESDANLPDYYFNNGSITVDIDKNKVMHVREELVVGFRESKEYFKRRVPAHAKSEKYKNGKVSDGRSFLAEIRDYSATVDGAPAECNVNKNGTNNYIYVQYPQGNYDSWRDDNKVTYKINLDYVCDFSADSDGAEILSYCFFEEVNSGYFYHASDPENRSRLYVTVNFPTDEIISAQLYYDNAEYEEGGLTADGGSVSFSVRYGFTSRYKLRVCLPEGYFDTHVAVYGEYWYFVGAVGALMLAGLIITFIFRKRKPLAPVEYSPPVLNVMDFSAHWHGIARRRDVCTILLQWANLGCIRLKKTGKNDLEIIKVKNLPKNRTSGEHRYFNALFSKGKVYRPEDVRGGRNRRRRWELMCAAGKLIVEAGEPVTYARGVVKARFAVMLLSFITPLVCFLYSIIISDDYPFLFALVFMVALIAAVSVSLNKVFGEFRVERQAYGKWFKFSYILATPAILPVMFMVWIMIETQYMVAYDYIGLLYISIGWIFISCYFLPPLIAKRSEESQKIYGRMAGFKNFLKAAKVPEMETMLEENPDYYLDVLPYCMIMGLSKKLDKKTEFLHAPDWADGFDDKTFAQSLSSSVRHSVVTRSKKEKQ